MKLLVVSHACVAPVNQALFADVARLSGWDVEIVVPASWDSEYSTGIEAVRWQTFRGELHKVAVWKSGNIPLHLYQQTLVGLLKKSKPDVIYVHHEPYGLATTQVYLANRLAGRVPIGFYAAQNIFKRYPLPFRWFERSVLRHSDFAFPVTQGALEVLRAKNYHGPAEVLPLALDQEVYYARPEWALNKRAELGFGPETFCFGYLGRFVEEKGLRSLLQAAATLQGQRDWRCLFVGSGVMEAELRRLSQELGLTEHVIFHDFVPHQEVPGWLSLFDVLMLPSETRSNWKEQFGRVIVEANACETAVIGSDSGEIPKVLAACGGGVIVPEASPSALADAMLDLLNHPEKTRALAQAGATSVRKQYDQELTAKRFLQALEQVLVQGASVR